MLLYTLTRWVWYRVHMAVLIKNKKAGFDYELLETYEAGIELFGYEVKALRQGKGKLDGAHVIVRGSEAFLVGASISPYQPSNTPASYDRERARRLLLSKKELAMLASRESQKGLTIVPLVVYNKGRNLKLEIAVARGKKKHDKREKVKERDTKRDIERILKSQHR